MMACSMIYQYFAALLFTTICFQLGRSAVVETSRDGLTAEVRSNELDDTIISEMKKLRDKLREMEEWRAQISTELKTLHDAHLKTDGDQPTKRRGRRSNSALLPPSGNATITQPQSGPYDPSTDCTPGTFGCPVGVTPYSASSSCILCPPGQFGPPGPPGPPGRDGRDAIAVVTSSNTPCSSPGGGGSDLSSTGGAVYIRWGHQSCPHTSELIYTGTGASSGHRADGGGVDQLCLPGNPHFHSPIAGVGNSRAFLYRLEYQLYERGDKNWHDVPCAVCMANSRYAMLMIPGTDECPSSDWTLEYGGYMMAERTHSSHHRSLHICVDQEIQVVPGTSDRSGELKGLMNFVEARCFTGGGIPCPPYVDGYELTCAVCTK